MGLTGLADTVCLLLSSLIALFPSPLLVGLGLCKQTGEDFGTSVRLLFLRKEKVEGLSKLRGDLVRGEGLVFSGGLGVGGNDAWPMSSSDLCRSTESCHVTLLRPLGD